MLRSLVVSCVLGAVCVWPAHGCNNKTEQKYIIGEVRSVSEMDSATNRTAIELHVSKSDFAKPDSTIVIYMEGGWRIPPPARSARLDEQMMKAVPCIVRDVRGGRLTFLFVNGQSVIVKVARDEGNGIWVVKQMGTLFFREAARNSEGVSVVRAALRAREFGDLRVWAGPPEALWIASMAYPDARIRTGRADAEWIDSYGFLLKDRSPTTIEAFLAE